MTQQMSSQQFIHTRLLSVKTVLDTYMYWGFTDENEEKIMVMWSLRKQLLLIFDRVG